MLGAAQSRLCQSSVLVIGAGGLGCPVVMYLAAAGVGRLGIVDHDRVELNNLHRQIAHRESTVGILKADSAGLTCRSINSSIQVEYQPTAACNLEANNTVSAYPYSRRKAQGLQHMACMELQQDSPANDMPSLHSTHLPAAFIGDACMQVEMFRDGITPQNAVELVRSFDVVVDATDNAPSRYLISDACVVAGRPLVSGAAIGTDGQLTLYNHGPDGEHSFPMPTLLAIMCICREPCFLSQPLAQMGSS